MTPTQEARMLGLWLLLSLAGLALWAWLVGRAVRRMLQWN